MWVEILFAVLAGALGAAAARTTIRTRGRCSAQREVTSSAPANAPETPAEPGRADLRLHQKHRCEQAVRRAWRAVDSVSSVQARDVLRSVVRRMEAELPNVDALVELGRSFDNGSGSVREHAATARVIEQLDDAVTRFALITDQVVETVVQLVAEPDLDRVHEQVAALREQFPLLRPMSALVGTAPGEPPPHP